MASSERTIPIARVIAPPSVAPLSSETPASGREIAIVVCRQCGEVFRTDVQLAGQWSQCPSCRQALQITIDCVVRLPEPKRPPPADQSAPSRSVPSADDIRPSMVRTPERPPVGDPPLPTYRPPPLPQRLAETVQEAHQTLRPGSPAKSGWQILALLGATLCLLATVLMILVALITAVIPSPNPDFAEQRWSGVVCALLTATVLGLPGAGLLRRGLRSDSEPPAALPTP